MNGSTRQLGLLAEFDSAEQLVTAARSLHDAGYRRLDAFTPYPVEGLAEALGFTRTRLPLMVLIGGIVRGLSGFALQWWTATQAYPLNIGGRPLNSWLAFIPVTFEATILVASLTAVLGMLALNGLPRPHHPLFAVAGFERATSHGYFLFVENRDAKFDRDTTTALLRSLVTRAVREVHDG